MNVKVKVKKAGRKRRAAGWVLLAIGIPVAAVWMWSGFSPAPILSAPSETYEGTEVVAGRLWITRIRPAVISAGERITRTYNLTLDERQKLRTGGWFVSYGIYTTECFKGFRSERLTRVYALWPLPALLWTTGGLALWSGRRARRRALEGHCPTCGYNLAGLNLDAPCPECGKAKA